MMGKILQDTTTIGDLTSDDGMGRNEEEGRAWSDFGQEYLAGPDGFTSVLTAYQSKAGILKEEGNERLSCRKGGSTGSEAPSKSRVKSGRLANRN